MFDDIEDELTDQTDKSCELICQIHKVRMIFDGLDLSPLARDVLSITSFKMIISVTGQVKRHKNNCTRYTTVC